MPRSCIAFLAALLLSSCAGLRNSAKYDFADGTYRTQFFGGRPSRVVGSPGTELEFAL